MFENKTPSLPSFDWSQPYVRADIQRYLHDLLGAMGWEPRRRRMRPTLDEVAQSLDQLVTYVNQGAELSEERHQALVITIRLMNSEFSRLWSDWERAHGHR